MIKSKADMEFDSLMCECESAVDNWQTSKFSLYRRLIVLKPAKKYASQIVEYYTRLKEELQELVEQKTPDLVEAYSYLKVPEQKKLLAFVSSLVDDASSYAFSQKKTRVKRKVSFEKVVSKLKFKQTDLDFKLNSIDPVIIPQAVVLFIFNTKYRDLYMYKAEDGKKLSVKGTTLQNFDEKGSSKKKIRKPEETLNDIIKTTKLRAEKLYHEVKTKSTSATGRINSDCILLKAIT